MPKLSQIIAIETGHKTRSHRALTDVYHTLDRAAQVCNGLERTYKPNNDDETPLPPENKRVELTGEGAITMAANAVREYWDITLTKDTANQSATADVVVGGVTLITAAPVTYLLFLEKQLSEMKSFIDRIPKLDEGTSWSLDPASGVWRSETVETIRTAKVPQLIKKAPATPQHPEQVDVWMADVPVGRWSTTRLSGGISAPRQAELSGRLDLLIDAVKFAREQANSIEAVSRRVAADVLGYLFGTGAAS